MLKLLAVAAALLAAGSAAAQVQVQGHYRSNGTYVAPYTRSSPDSSTYNNRPYQAPSYSAPAYHAPAPLYGSSSSSSSSCSGYGCYGQPSATTGAPRTNTVSGYVRSDGTYVAPYARSSPR